MPLTSLADMVLQRVKNDTSSRAFRVRRGDAYHDVTWGDIADRLENIAAGLLTAMDLADDAHVTIIGNTSLDWVVCDFAALSIGLRTVPVYASLLPEEVGYMHCDTDSVLAIVDDGDQLDKIRAMRTGFKFFETDYTPEQVPLKHVVIIDPTGVEPADDWESLADLEKRGADKLAELRGELERRRGIIERDHTATYTYTSGTTGAPKAVIQTHDNMLSMLESCQEIELFNEEVRQGGLFLFLPLAHSFGRLIELAGPFFDSPIVLSSVPTLVEDLGMSKPGFFPSAPRVYEKMKAKVDGGVAGATPTRQKLFHWAMATGQATIPYESRGEPIPFMLGLKLKLADRLVLSKLRARLGFDNTALALSGSAPLNVDVHAFFLGMGVPLMEAYGLTETCPGLTTNKPGAFRLGNGRAGLRRRRDQDRRRR